MTSPGPRASAVSLPTVVLATLLATVALGCAERTGRDPGAAKESSPTLEPWNTYVLDGPDLSIGEVIDRSALVAKATVLTIGTPLWNAPDGSGREWNDLYEANPEEYSTSPMLLTEVTIQIDQILGQDDIKKAPRIIEGQKVVVTFRQYPALNRLTSDQANQLDPIARLKLLAEGDERLFFLEWASYPDPVADVGPLMWRSDTEIEGWGVSAAGRAFPLYARHASSLGSPGARHDFGVTTDRELQTPTIPFDDLAKLVAEEWASPDKATVASYEEWPP
jgi:hypothetical protein